jgi:hypothetical protein
VVVAERQAGRHLGSVGSEVLTDALAEWLEGLEAGAAPGGVDADALGGEVVDGDEHGGRSLGGPAGGGVDPPHGVRAVRDDRAVVRGRAVRLAGPCRGEESRLAHQPEHPRLTGPDPGQAQACPHLPVAFTDERRARQDAADLLGQLGVRPRRLRPTLQGHHRRLPPAARRVDRRPGDLRDAADAGQAVPPRCGGRGRLAHYLDLLRPKGPSASARRARSRSSSFAIVSSPIFARSRPSSSSRSSAGRLFTAACPPVRNCSRHCAIVPAVTPPRDSTRRDPHHAALAGRPRSCAARTTVPAHRSPHAPRSWTFPPRGIMPRLVYLRAGGRGLQPRLRGCRAGARHAPAAERLAPDWLALRPTPARGVTQERPVLPEVGLSSS